MFLEGNTAMVFTGSWDAVTFSGVKAEEMSGKVGFFNFPAIPDGLGDPHSINASYSNGWGFSSKLTEKEKRVVHAFIKLTFSQEMFKRRLMESNLLPSVQLEDTRGVDPLLGEIIRTINRASGTWKAYDAIVQPTVKVEIDNALQSLIARASSPREVAARLQKVQEEANRQMNE